MNCPSCNTPIPADAAFCPSCGKKPGAATPNRPAARPTYSGLGTVAPMRESRATVLEPGTRFAERYEVIRKLGEGGMGIVYVARDTNTGEEMVLKLIHPDLVTGEEAVRRLMAEGLTARQIRHPNIVAVYDVSQWGGQPYFTMEYVKGGTMRSWLINDISNGREVQLATAAGLMRSMLAGLAEAHRMGVVHRDLKPENVLLCGDPDADNFELKILDFGIAKAIGTNPATRSGGSGGSGGAIGTPIYMAPEQMTSADAVGPAADFYSLSVMLYEMLMEAPPQGRWEPVSKNRRDVPRAVDDVIEKGLSARPRSRYQSAAEYLAALDAAVGGARPGPIIVPDPTPVPPPPPPPDRKPWYQYQGLLAGSSRKTKMWVGGIALFVIIGIIGNMSENASGGIDDVQNEDVTPPPPPVFNAAGFWVDAYGNRFEVTHDGTNFTATGNVRGYGLVSLSGTLTLAGARFTLRTQAGAVLQGTGEVYRDGGGLPHMRYTLVDGSAGDFKINHYN